MLPLSQMSTGNNIPIFPISGRNPAPHTQSHQGSQVPPHTKDQSGRSWAHRKLLDLISFPSGWSGGGGGGDKGSNSSGTKWAHGHMAAAAELCVLHSRAEMLHQVTLQKGRDQEATESPPMLWLHAKSRGQVLNPLPQKSLLVLGQAQTPPSSEHSAIHSTWMGITSRPGCLATCLPQPPAPCQSGGQRGGRPVLGNRGVGGRSWRPAMPNSGWSSISCSTESARLQGPHNNPFVAVTPEEPVLKSVAATKPGPVKGP